MSFIHEIQRHWGLAASRIPVLFLLTVLFGTLLCRPASAADITVSSPVNGTKVSSPLSIQAKNVGCDGDTPTAFGYSIDDSSSLVKGESPSEIDVTNQSFAAGQHAVHFKSWTKAGICPVISVDFTVVNSGEQAPYGVPEDAISSGDLDGKGPWTETHDGGTPGKSKGSMVYPAHTPTYDDGREFYMTYTDRAGERWSVDVAKDPDATYFVLDTYVYLPNPSEVLNLELDIDQVVADGETVILSTQCSGVNGSWEAGYTAGKEDHWWASGIKCNPAEWTANVWHHIQIGEHRDANGVVTHDWVSVDGKVSNWGYTQESAHYLDWGAGVVNIQYQIEGTSKTSGTVTSYIHNMTVYRWQP